MSRARRVLVLMRHGKAVDGAGMPDRARPLAARGVREAKLAGDWIRDRLTPVQAVLCSTAQRTRETLQATGIEAPATFEPAIYEAAPHTLIDVISAADPAAATVLLVGHSPGIPWTAWELASNRSSPAAEELSKEFPTSALAVLEISCPWSGISTGMGELVHFHVPR